MAPASVPAQTRDDWTPADGLLLARKRKLAGMSQPALGRELAVSPATICRWERGHLTPEHPGMLWLAMEKLLERHGATLGSGRPRRA